MPNEDKFYARLAGVLLVAAFLVPIVIAAFSKDLYAVIFFGFAITFAVLFAGVSWTKRSSKYVASVAGLTGCMIVSTFFLLTYTMPWKRAEAEASFQAIAAEHEAARLQVIAERENKSSGLRSDAPQSPDEAF